MNGDATAADRGIEKNVKVVILSIFFVKFVF